MAIITSNIYILKDVNRKFHNMNCALRLLFLIITYEANKNKLLSEIQNAKHTNKVTTLSEARIWCIL